MSGIARTPCDDGVIRAAAPDAHGCAAKAKPWVLAATILGSSMAFIDGSVVSVALPAIQADLAAAVREAQWIVNAYMLMFLYFALSGGMFFLPFNLIQIQGYSAMAAGATFLPLTLVMGGLSRWSWSAPSTNHSCAASR